MHGLVRAGLGPHVGALDVLLSSRGAVGTNPQHHAGTRMRAWTCVNAWGRWYRLYRRSAGYQARYSASGPGRINPLAAGGTSPSAARQQSARLTTKSS